MTALVYRDNDLESLASSIERALSDPAMAARLRRQARQRVATRYPWDRLAEDYRRVLVG